MRIIARIFIVSQLFLLTAGKPQNANNLGNVITFGPGEEITYRAHYGFINAAVGKMVIDEDVKVMNGYKCFKIDVFGESVGMFNLMLKIDDNWGTYLDTGRLLPARFYRKIKEGNYRKHEIVDFNQQDKKAVVVKYDYKREKWKDPAQYEIPVNSQDLVSGYYYFRTLDFSPYTKGDTIALRGFFDDEVYHFQIRYLGKTIIKTKLGKMPSLEFSPIMPENSLFDGKNSIRFWLSDDEYKVPLKIKASMFVGAVEIDIMEFKPGKY